ncbi:MAG: hypothetical protein AAF725_00835 [Acidobacteriota bacterium]
MKRSDGARQHDDDVSGSYSSLSAEMIERASRRESLPPERTAKEQMATIIRDLPDDSSYDDVLRELAFYRMIQRGLADADAARCLGDDVVRRRVRGW